jgi:hypothetical protein
MIDILDASSDERALTPESVEANLAVTTSLARQEIVPDNMLPFVKKLGDQVSILAESGETDETVDRLASAVFDQLGFMGSATANAVTDPLTTDVFGGRRLSSHSHERSHRARRSSRQSVNVNNAQNGVFFPAREWSEAASVVSPHHWTAKAAAAKAGQRILKDLHAKRKRAPRKSTSPLDEAPVMGEYIVTPGVFPDWSAVPTKLQDLDYASSLAMDARPRSLSAHSAESGDMFDQQELLELEWKAFINASDTQAAYSNAQAALDDEYFANYTSHLAAAEREVVVREWWEERARLEALTASAAYKQSRFTEQMFEQISSIMSTLVKFMVNGERVKTFNFPMGQILIGKTKDLLNTSEDFHFQDPKWKIAGAVTGAYGFGEIKFTQVNPMSWATNAPKGPFLVSSLEIYRDDGTQVPVQGEPQPLNIMTEHSSFASASCFYWDWQENNGLGGWSQSGVLNSENGCSSTHLSVIGMFLDVAATDDGIELPSSVDESFAKTVTEYNYSVIASMCVVVLICALGHFWGTRQDEQDFAKVRQEPKLGDGINGPRSLDDPVKYSRTRIKVVLGTFWNLICRDHVLVSCFRMCPKKKTTRLQKVSILFAALAGTSAVCALFYGEHIINPKHYIEVGIIAAVITYPMIRTIRLMFSSRPYREPAPLAPLPRHVGAQEGPLVALPASEEDEEFDDYYDGQSNFASPANLALPALAAPPSRSPEGAAAMGARLPLPEVQALASASSPGVHSSPGSAPEEGGGPVPALGDSPAPPPPRDGIPLSEPGAGGGPDATFGDNLAPPPPPKGMVPSAEHGMSPSPGNGPVTPSSGFTGHLSDFTSTSQSATLPAAGFAGVVPGAPPQPPLGGFQHSENNLQLATIPQVPTGPAIDSLSPILPAPEDARAGDLGPSQRQIMQRVRRIHIENVIRKSERLAYDERVDMRSSVPHPMAQVANCLAYTAVVSYWTTALVLTTVYAVHLNSQDAVRWLYACLASWVFTCFVLEVVKAMLVTVLELQQLHQRTLLSLDRSLKRQAEAKRDIKRKQMASNQEQYLEWKQPPVPPDSDQQEDLAAGPGPKMLLRSPSQWD